MTPPFSFPFPYRLESPLIDSDSGFAISRTEFRLPYLFVCIETRLISISSFRRGSTCFLWGSKAMSTSNCTLSSPPPRPRPEGRAQTRSSGAADSPCVLCSPPARPAGDGLDVRSPLDGRVAAVEDPVALIVESWCSPTLVSPAGRPCSVMQLEQHQAAGPVDICDAFLEDEKWDMGLVAHTQREPPARKADTFILTRAVTFNAQCTRVHIAVPGRPRTRCNNRVA